MEKKNGLKPAYEAPVVVELGSLYDLTLWEPCNKDLGGSDGFTFQQQQVVCVSA